MQKAIIYQPTKNAMQSGNRNSKQWIVEFKKANERFNEPIMGWIANSDTLSTQVKLKFATQKEAIEYAIRENLEYEIIEPKKSKLRIQKYADNFSYCPPES